MLLEGQGILWHGMGSSISGEPDPATSSFRSSSPSEVGSSLNTELRIHGSIMWRTERSLARGSLISQMDGFYPAGNWEISVVVAFGSWAEAGRAGSGCPAGKQFLRGENRLVHMKKRRKVHGNCDLNWVLQ